MEKEKTISVRSVTKGHAKIIDWMDRNHPNFDDCKMVQSYFCDGCKKVNHTLIVNYGATPMFHSCSNCGSMSTSTGQKEVSELLREEPICIEEVWYYPTLEETLKLRKKPHMLQHVLDGGLLNRKEKINLYEHTRN